MVELHNKIQFVDRLPFEINGHIEEEETFVDLTTPCIIGDHRGLS